ncbi:MAG: hypothetical protein HY711_02325 [Candidatus Melainabacteria bacterium]|nr:hypothetical protein [Candidatus Melainabacteria bacterium]
MPKSQDNQAVPPKPSGGQVDLDKLQRRRDLAKILIEQKLISPAQAQLAMVDEEVSGMSFEEVLLARHWIAEDTLERVAPWLHSHPEPQLTPLIKPGSQNYSDNLKQYRTIIEKILDTAWD